MLKSMTGFASVEGALEGTSWVWDLRSVNGRGFDVRLRLPDGFSSLEAPVRARLADSATRGTFTVGLRLSRGTSEGALEVDIDRLDTVLDALEQVQERAFAKGVTLGQPTAADVLAQRGVLVSATPKDNAELVSALQADFDAALTQLHQMRQTEGAALNTILTRQIDEIAALTQQARNAAAVRAETMPALIQAALDRIKVDVPQNRLAQEVALLAVKSDITEEIDRLKAHVKAARDLIDSGSPAGRKLDFLTQEFNREANTLCSKAQDQSLTQIGLDLKAVIDQMREQVQNVE